MLLSAVLFSLLYQLGSRCRDSHRQFALHMDEERVSTVTEEFSKKRLDAYLSSVLQEYSRSYLSGLCESELVVVNDKVQNKSYKVKIGDRVQVTIKEKQQSSLEPENIPLDIIYEDDMVIAVNKASGMVVHPAVGSPNGTFVNALLHHLGEGTALKLLEDTREGTEENPNPAAEKGMTDNVYEDEQSVFEDPFVKDSFFDSKDLSVDEALLLASMEVTQQPEPSTQSLRPGIVHRLDKGTSGVLLAGKTFDAVSKLSHIFASRQIEKLYIAVCLGHPGDGTIANFIGRSKKNRQMMDVCEGAPGKPAVSHVRTLAFNGKLSLCLIRIETGRTHQIRVHLRERRTPVIGDETYGNKDWNLKLSRSDSVVRPLLHAYQLKCTHPFTHEPLCLQAPLPDDIYAIAQKICSPQALVIDPETKLLLCDTEVSGGGAGDIGMQASRGRFVPYDRLSWVEDEWTSMDLPDELPDE